MYCDNPRLWAPVVAKLQSGSLRKVLEIAPWITSLARSELSRLQRDVPLPSPKKPETQAAPAKSQGNSKWGWILAVSILSSIGRLISSGGPSSTRNHNPPAINYQQQAPPFENPSGDVFKGMTREQQEQVEEALRKTFQQNAPGNASKPPPNDTITIPKNYLDQ
jgi:hypothetical protein